MKTPLLTSLLAGLLLAGIGASAYADDEWREGSPWTWEQHRWQPQQHPYYAHALSDLQMARELLARPDYPNIQQDERRAVNEINAAIQEIRDAASDDGKNLNSPPPPDAPWKPEDRFHQALLLLNKARQDAGHQEDDPYLRGLQRHIVRHIDAAKGAVNQAVAEALR